MQIQQSLTKDKSVLYDYVNISTFSKEQVITLLNYLTDNIGKRFIMMGCLLSVIRKNKWYEPHKTLMDFCDSSIGLTYRKAMYLIQIYESLVANHIPFNEVEDSGLGYYKFVLISTHLTDSNYKELISWAKDLTTEEIEAELKESAKKALISAKNVSNLGLLSPDCVETSSTKVVKPMVSDLKEILITTPVTMVIEALRILYPSNDFTLEV